MDLGLIVATDRNGVIGVGNTLPWKRSADLRRFRRVTQGSVLIVGRRTWVSIAKPLPDRQLIVVSHNPIPNLPPGVESAPSLEDAVWQAAKHQVPIWFAGGEVIYHQALKLPELSAIDLTVVEDTVPLPLYDSIPVARFPGIPAEFHCVFEETNPEDPTLTHRTYHRRKPSTTAFKAIRSSMYPLIKTLPPK